VNTVRYCPKCGAETDEEMAFCPKCGVSLKAEQPADWRQQSRESRREWREKRRELREQRRETARNEKEEKWEKTEKYEKHEHGFMGPLIGGLILIFLGLMFYYSVTAHFRFEVIWASFFVIIGLIVIATAVRGAVVATRRHP